MDFIFLILLFDQLLYIGTHTTKTHEINHEKIVYIYQKNKNSCFDGGQILIELAISRCHKLLRGNEPGLAAGELQLHKSQVLNDHGYHFQWYFYRVFPKFADLKYVGLNSWLILKFYFFLQIRVNPITEFAQRLFAQTDAIY